MVGELLVITSCYSYSYSSTGAMLSFNQSLYFIKENITPLLVGLMLSRRASKDVIVEVTISNGSAKGR